MSFVLAAELVRRHSLRVRVSFPVRRPHINWPRNIDRRSLKAKKKEKKKNPRKKRRMMMTMMTSDEFELKRIHLAAVAFGEEA